LHKLGDSRWQSGDGPVLVTERTDGSIAILLWNLIPLSPGQRTSTGDPTLQTGVQYSSEGATKEFVLAFEGERRHLKGKITRVDENSGSLRRAYEQMGSPAYPSVQQIEKLKRNSEVAKPENATFTARGELTVRIPPNGVALVELAWIRQRCSGSASGSVCRETSAEGLGKSLKWLTYG